MRIDQIRLQNLQILVEEFGSTDELHRVSKVSGEYLDQLLNGTTLKNGNPRKMGDPVARKLERGCKKEDGWMDTTHQPVSSSEPDQIVLSPVEQTLLVKYRQASDKIRRIVMLVLDISSD